MSVEPPPSDWASARDIFAHKDPILDSDEGRVARVTPRITLEDDRSRSTHPGVPSPSSELKAPGRVHLVRRSSIRHDPQIQNPLLLRLLTFWDEFAFTLWRRDQMVGIVGLIVLLIVVALAIQEGPFTALPTSVLPASPDEGFPAAPDLISESISDGSGRTSGPSSDGESTISATDLDEDDSAESAGSKLFGTKNTTGTKSIPQNVQSGATGDITTSGDRQLTVATLQLEPVDVDASLAPGTPISPTTGVRYETCAEAAAAGAAPIKLGQPGYRLSLDRDKDGVACETGSVPESFGDATPDSLLTATSSSIPAVGSTTAGSATTGGGRTTATLTSSSTSGSEGTDPDTTVETTTSSAPTSASTTNPTMASTSTSQTTTSTTATSTTAFSATSTASTTTTATSSTVSSKTTMADSTTSTQPPTSPLPTATSTSDPIGEPPITNPAGNTRGHRGAA